LSRKANVVVNALSRKERPKPIRVKAYQLIMTSDIMKLIQEDQTEAMKEEHQRNERMLDRLEQLGENEYGVKTMYGQIWIPRYRGIKGKILNEAHKTWYSVHPGGIKMFMDLRRDYWWPNMKLDIT
jgi:hypothetical protein